MTRRADAPGDLLFGLIALQRGLVDQSQLAAACEIWRNAGDRTMAEILLAQGALDEAQRALVDDAVASQLEAWLALATEDHDDLDRTREFVPGAAGAAELTERFRIVRPYAQGGLGEVFLAIDPELERQVALKELRAHYAHDPVSQWRFLLEAKLTGRLEHPGIVPVYGLGRHADGRPYYAMRFIEGETLKQAIERFHGPEGSALEPGARELAFRRLLRSVIDACNAVAYAHSRGVVHRDLKPENIMLGRFGETLVVDWGIAKPLADTQLEGLDGAGFEDLAAESFLTRPGSALGTPQYMSPEQAAGDLARVGPASDVYGLGATLYAVLVGHGPFPSGSVAEVLRRVRRGVFPAPRRLRRSIDRALEAICLKAMAREPEARHASPLTLAEEIEAHLADVRYRSEQERALQEVRRSLARLCVERAHNLFGREMRNEGMLWLARALENVPPDSVDLERALRASLGGWHGRAKLLERTLAHGGEVHAVAFGPDGRSLITAGADRTARLWDLAKGAPLLSPMRHPAAVRAIALSPDGKMLATASDDGSVWRWDALAGALAGDPLQHGAAVRAVRFSPDGSRIVTASRSGLPCLWEAATGRLIARAAGRDAEVLAVAFHPDGTILATASDDGLVRFCETETGTLHRQSLRHDAPVPDLAYSPDGRKLATGCRDGRARIWDASRLTTLAELPHAAEVGCVAFSPAGQSVATGSHDGTARLWDAETARPIGEPLAHGARVDCLSYNPEGTILATASQDGMVRLWDAGTGLPIGPPLAHPHTVGAVHLVAGRLEPSGAHVRAVSAVVFSRDGRRLVTACSDGKARAWRVPAPVAGDVERIVCWVHVATELEFDEGDAIRRLDPLAVWELRRRLQELGGAPLK
jgi:WD40 repeat protein/serine/threonine protein kinase